MGWRSHFERKHHRCGWNSRTSFRGRVGEEMNDGERERSGTAEFVSGCCPGWVTAQTKLCLRLFTSGGWDNTRAIFIILRKYLKIFDS